jgi:hypothetical protein
MEIRLTSVFKATFSPLTYNQAIPLHHNKSRIEEFLSNLSCMYRLDNAAMATALSEAVTAALRCIKLYSHHKKNDLIREQAL